VINGTDDCFTFLLDRDHDGNSISASDPAGGFRLMADGDIGIIEMWVGNNQPDCAAIAGATDWVRVTNPASMDITEFTITEFAIDGSLSYDEVIFDDGAGNTISQRVRKLRLRLRAELVTDANITRHIEDVITVRNDLLL